MHVLLFKNVEKVNMNIADLLLFPIEFVKKNNVNVKME